MSTVTPKGDGLAMLVLNCSMLAISWVAVIVRFLVRRLIHAVGADDWLMGSGMIFYSISAGFTVAVVFYGAGYHSSELDPATMAMGIKWFFFAQIFYCACTIPIKCSICAALLRISSTRVVYRNLLYLLIFVSAASGLASLITILSICKPIPAMWGAAEGTCDSSLNAKIGYFLSASSIVTDWSLAILPAFMLWKVQLKTRIKASIIIILALGAFASCATIVRLRYLLYYNNPSELLIAAAKMAIWTSLEVGMGVTAGCLPHLRPLLRYVPFLSRSTYAAGSGAQSGTLHNNTYGRGTNNLEMYPTSRTMVEGGGGGGGTRRITGKSEIDMESDGESQKHILEEIEGDLAHNPAKNGQIVMKTEVTVTGYTNETPPNTGGN